MPERAGNFDPLARPYRWLEYLTFGPFLERCRFHFLHKLADRRRALILGDGDGRFTARFLADNPQATVLAIDSSLAMLDLLTRRVANAGPAARGRLQTRNEDLRAFCSPIGSTFDLVVSHFFLDCLTEAEIASLVGQIKPHLAPGALWLISEFAIPDRQPMKLVCQATIGSLYLAFRLFTGMKTRKLPRYGAQMREAGLDRKSVV